MGKEILIAEDEQSLARTCARVLEQQGYDVRQVHDGVAALQAVAEQRPALIVLDLLLPKKDGRAVLTELRESEATRNVPVIAMSGVFKGRATQREVAQAGAQGFLEKPFPAENLLREIRRLIGSAELAPAQTEPGRARLSDVHIAEFIWRQMRDGFSGVLHFKREKLHKMLLLREGRPVSIRSNAVKETLGRFMVARGQLSQVAFDESVRRSRAEGRRQGEILLDMGVIKERELRAEIVANAAAKLLELFGWLDGEGWTEAGIERLPYASPLDGWNPHRVILRGVRRIPPARLRAILAPFEEFGVCPTDALQPQDRSLPAVAALLSALGPDIRVRSLLRDHVAALYGLWLIEAVNLSPIIEDPAVSQTIRSIPIPGGEGGDELEQQLAYLQSQSYFEVLGVRPGASSSEIQQAYLGLAKRFHPDRFSADSEERKHSAAQIFGLISQARDTLSDPARAKEYQATLKGDETEAQRVQKLLEAEKLCHEGEGLLRKREFQAALAKFERATELDPGEGELHALSGWAYFVANREAPGAEQQALKRLEKAKLLAPESTKGYYYLAQLHKACGRIPEAQKLLRRVLDMDPTHVEAGQALRVLQMRNQKDKKTPGGLFGLGRKKK